MIRSLILIPILSVLVALAFNFVNPKSIPLVGSYHTVSGGDGPVIPPEADPNDPPFIDINTAQIEWATRHALFVDARDVHEYQCGTIPGSVSMPFEYLPDQDDLTDYVDSVLLGADKDDLIITFCSGEECDLSLHLARLFQDYGYTQVTIFFGGAREWEKFGYEVQRSPECAE